MLRIGIVAGEASGDYLGASLIKSLRTQIPDVIVEGIGGRQMEQAGCRLIQPMEKLSVMGFVEVLGRYSELKRLRRELIEHFIENSPDIFIGIDAPDFNLHIEHQLRQHDIKTVHLVSPQVWAWREYRLKKIAKAVDLMLVVFPFEKTYYEKHHIPAVYVGHPLADQIPLRPDKSGARERLGLPSDKLIIAIMPGSRRMEQEKLMIPFLLAAQWCLNRRNDLHFVTSLLTDEAIGLFKDSMDELSLDGLPVSFYKRSSHDVLEAADIVLLASGTISLEAMLYKKPMVVAYKMNGLTYAIVRALVRVKYAALPNLLAGTEVVPECLQSECKPERLGREIMKWLNDAEAIATLEKTFTKMHQQLKLNAGDSAARAVLGLCRQA